jgi:outer membrane protein assembly factor BamD
MTGGAVRRRCVVCLVAAVVLATAGCGGKKKKAAETAPIRTEAAFDNATRLLAKRQLTQAMSALKRIQFDAETRAELEPLTRLAMADATFYQGTTVAYIDSRNLYLDFVTMHGDHPLAPYAQLQVGLCSLKQVNQPSKDQTLTRQAIRDLGAVRQRWPNSGYADAARSLESEARGNLAESEYLIGRFYLKRKNYPAAINRLRGIVIGYPDYPEPEKILFNLAKALVHSGKEAEARVYLDRIVSSHPDGEYVTRAEKTLVALEGNLESGFVTSSE